MVDFSPKMAAVYYTQYRQCYNALMIARFLFVYQFLLWSLWT